MANRSSKKFKFVGYHGNMLTFFSPDPYEDPFEKKSEARKERIAKNEYQRLCNIARTEKSGRVKGVIDTYYF